METATTLKVGLIFAAAFGLALLTPRLQPPRQTHTGGCGPRALRILAATFGASLTEAQTLALFPNNGFEVSLGEMQSKASLLGLNARSRQMTVADLRREKPLGVLHVDSTHFVALVAYDGEAALIVDPLYQGESHPVRWLFDDLQTRWDGAILIVQPLQKR